MLLIDYEEEMVLIGDRLAVFDEDDGKLYVLMIVEGCSTDFPLTVMIAAGRKAGRTVCYLPSECVLPGTLMVSTAWLIANWYNRIGFGNVGKVKFLGRPD